MTVAKSFTQLPEFWRDARNYERTFVVSLLKQGKPLFEMPEWWKGAHYSDRWAVINYLVYTGSLTPDQRSALARPQFPEITSIAYVPFTHVRPNGGKRILPSAYTQLREFWVRSNGTQVDPVDMNEGHLENTLKLLKESHGNLMSKVTGLLGVMARHYHNQPQMVQLLEEACRVVQETEVDEVYPVWAELSKALQAKQANTEEPVEWTWNPVNDNFELWD